MIVGPPKLPALCDLCGGQTPFADIPQDRYRLLLDDYYLRYFSAELCDLEKVADFYRRNPNAKGRVLTHADRVMEAGDPKVMEQMADGVPFDEIELPPEPELQLDSPAPDDAEVIEYLKHNSFDLERRTAFVKGQIGDLNARAESVVCAQCGQGRLHLLEEPHVATPEEIAAMEAESARVKAEYDAGAERREQERLDMIAAKDAAITDRRCPFCGKPCPSYRKTCKHCGEPVRSGQ